MVECSDEEYAAICSTVAGPGCSQPTAMTSAFDLTWCEDCKQRGDLANWGEAHHWPALEAPPYAIAAGAYYWHIAVTMANDDEIWLMLGLTEMLDQAEQATQNALQRLV